MKSAPTGLITLLGTGSFVFCDLYQFTLVTGQVLRYTTADIDIVAPTPIGFAPVGNLFSDASWSNRVNSTITPNSGTSPDGTNDAWLWQRSSTALAYVASPPIAKAATSQVYRGEISAKPGTGNFLALRLQDANGTADAVFNVSTGTVTTTSTGGAGWSGVSASIFPAGNGFYRCYVTATSSNDVNVLFLFSGNSNGVILAGTDSVSNTTILVFTAQLDVVGTYSSALFFDQSGNKAVGHWKTGLDVDTWQVYIMPVEFDPVTGTQFPIKIGSTGWLAAVAAGALAGATVDIHRAYWASWPQPWQSPLVAFTDGSGTYVIVDYFAGRVAAVDVMRNQAVVSVNSWLDQFQLMMPRNLWQAACRWTLFDAGCTLSQASFAVTGTAQAGSTQSQIVTSGLLKPSGYFTLGQVTMTSGLNSGFRRMVKSFDGVTMLLIAPFPFAVAVADAFTAFPGCDKSLQTCTNKFNNVVNYGGEDLIPKPETAV